jgi:hypothetical protein
LVDWSGGKNREASISLELCFQQGKGLVVEIKETLLDKIIDLENGSDGEAYKVSRPEFFEVQTSW